ncbi:MAG: SCO family protein [Bdellovibrionales bacterium]|nr:SCO family protein [Bdellovibrionales bacterium]
MIQKNWKSSPKQLFKLLLFFFSIPTLAYEGKKNYLAEEAPLPLKDMKVVEKTGQSIDLALQFKDSPGHTVSLKNLFTESAILMTVVYYNCPSLCNFHLNGLFDAMQKIPQTAGKDYTFIAVSMDASETPKLADNKKTTYLKKFNRSGQKVHFLTGESENIKKLTKSLGFPFRWDEATNQFAHSPVAYLLSPKGQILRYLYGVEFKPETLRLSLVEASQGRIGTITDRIRLFCYRFNPGENRYTLYAYNLMRAGAGFMAFTLLVTLVPYWIKERKLS